MGAEASAVCLDVLRRLGILHVSAFGYNQYRSRRGVRKMGVAGRASQGDW